MHKVAVMEKNLIRDDSQDDILPVNLGPEVRTETIKTGVDASFRRLWSGVKSAYALVFRRQYWSRESLYLLGSAVMVCILAAVLNMYDERPLSDWDSRITLNAFVSIIVTLLYILLMLPISNCISQLKWLHFRTAKSLHDFQIYDELSRGSLNLSLFKMLLRRGYSPLVPLAILLAVSTLAVGPLSQQVLQFDVINFPAPGQSLLPIARNLTGGLLDEATPKQGIASALSSALLATTPSEFYVKPICSNGNCTWGGYATLSLQSQCKNMTDQMVFADPATISKFLDADPTELGSMDNSTGQDSSPPLVSLGNSTVLTLGRFRQNSRNNLDEFEPSDSTYSEGFSMVLVNGTDPSGHYFGHSASNSPKNVPTPQSLTTRNVQMLFLDGNVTGHISINSSNSNYSTAPTSESRLNVLHRGAWDCTLQFALQPLVATYLSGRFSENNTEPAILYNDESLIGTSDNCSAYGNCTLQLEHYGQPYMMDIGFPSQIFDAIFQEFDGFSYVPLNPGVPLYVQLDPEASSPGYDFIHYVAANELGALKDNPDADQAHNDDDDPSENPIEDDDYDTGNGYVDIPQTVDNLMDNVAAGLTRFMREYESHNVSGTVLITQAAYRIKWAWISIPVILIIGTAVLVFFTALETKREGIPVWTNSALAMMVHGVDNATSDELAKLLDTDKLDTTAKEMKVQFGGRNFKLQVMEDKSDPS